MGTQSGSGAHFGLAAQAGHGETLGGGAHAELADAGAHLVDAGTGFELFEHRAQTSLQAPVVDVQLRLQQGQLGLGQAALFGGFGSGQVSLAQFASHRGALGAGLPT